MKKYMILLTALLFVNVSYAADILEGKWNTIKIGCVGGGEDLFKGFDEIEMTFKDGFYTTSVSTAKVVISSTKGQYFINENILTQISLETENLGSGFKKITKIVPNEIYFTQVNGAMVLVAGSGGLCSDKSASVLTMVRTN